MTSYIVNRIVSCLGGFRYGARTWCKPLWFHAWMEMVIKPYDDSEIVYHAECVNTAFLHCNFSSVDSSLSESPLESLQSFFAHPPLPVYTHMQLHSHPKPPSSRHRPLLSAAALSLNMPLQGTVWPSSTTATCPPPCALDNEPVSDMVSEALIRQSYCFESY